MNNSTDTVYTGVLLISTIFSFSAFFYSLNTVNELILKQERRNDVVIAINEKNRSGAYE